MKEAEKLDSILKELIKSFDEDSLHHSVSFYDIYKQFNGDFWRTGMSHCLNKLESDGLLTCTTMQKHHLSDNKDDYDYFVTIVDTTRNFINEGGYTQKGNIERERQNLIDGKTRLEIENAKRQQVLIKNEEMKLVKHARVFQKANGESPLTDLHSKVQEVAS